MIDRKPPQGPLRRLWPLCMLGLLFACGAPVLAPAATADALTAHPAVRYDPKDRCPDLRVSDEGDTVVVVFMVNPYGSPSQVHVRAPSGVAGLDAAAVSCVMKLKFQPATRPGDAQPMDSWQQLGLRYATPVHSASTGASASAPAGAAAGTVALAAVAPSAGAPAGGGTSGVHVCTDAAGRLTQDPKVTHSSGDPALDAAAVRIASAGAGNYRPAGAQLSGCAQVSVTFER